MSISYSLEPMGRLSYMAKGILQMGLRLRTLRWGCYYGLSEWVQSNSRESSKADHFSQLWMERHMRTEVGSKRWNVAIQKVEE